MRKLPVVLILVFASFQLYAKDISEFEEDAVFDNAYLALKELEVLADKISKTKQMNA